MKTSNKNLIKEVTKENIALVKNLENAGSKDVRIYLYRSCSAIVSNDDGLLHISIGGDNRKPSIEEVLFLSSKLAPKDKMMIIGNSMGINSDVIHLWEATV